MLRGRQAGRREEKAEGRQTSVQECWRRGEEWVWVVSSPPLSRALYIQGWSTCLLPLGPYTLWSLHCSVSLLSARKKVRKSQKAGFSHKVTAPASWDPQAGSWLLPGEHGVCDYALPSSVSEELPKPYEDKHGQQHKCYFLFLILEDIVQFLICQTKRPGKGAKEVRCPRVM